MNNDDFVIEWLKMYFDKPDIDENKLKPVLHFSLLWNLFEFTYFTDENRLSPKTLIDLSDISIEYINDETINQTFTYFKERYFLNNILDDKFETLLLEKNNNINGQSNYEFCRLVFTKENPVKLEKTKCIFLIIHRFRNNLFHGRKNPETLIIYEQPFININKFLIEYIQNTAENNNINSKRLSAFL